VAVGGYLNEVGLPDFIKNPLLQKLRARGLDLQFTRLRLRWYRGLVADNVRFGSLNRSPIDPRFTAAEVEVRLDHAALRRFQVNVDSLALHDAQVIWPLAQTNAAEQPLAVTNIQVELRFLPGDRWELDHLTGMAAGLQMRFFMSVTNASSLRDWPMFHHAPGAQPVTTENRLRRVADTLDKIKFPSPPTLNLTLRGDARSPQSFHGVVTLNAPGAETPWGTLTNGVLITRLIAATNGTPPQADVELRADDAVTGPDDARKFNLHLHVTAPATLTNDMQAALEVSAGTFTTEWSQIAGVQFTSEWTQSPTNSIPASGVGNLRLTSARTRWGDVGTVDLTARLNPPATNQPRTADASWGWWRGLDPYSLDWNCRLGDIHAEDPRVGVFLLKEFDCGGTWRSPELTLTNAHAELYQGRFDASAALNVATRDLTFTGVSDFDAQKTLPLLTQGGREWLEQFGWTNPPLVHASGKLTLPAWTNRQPDWRGEVLPTLGLYGDVKTAEAAFRGVPVSAASLHFAYSNMTWLIPDLVATRPEGGLQLATESDDRTKRFHFKFHSTIDPKSARHLLPHDTQQAVDLIEFTQPPDIDAELWGQWHDPDQLGGTAVITLTNFSLRGQSATYLHATLQYTNQFIVITDPRIERGGNEYLTASALGIDPVAKLAYLTNGIGIFEAEPFFKAIGPKVFEVMQPYQFGHAPTAHAHGTIPLTEDPVADLHVILDGGPFHWMMFNLDQISGGLDWVGNKLFLTNVQAAFYQGNLTGAATFDFSPHEGADFNFGLQITNTDLHAFMADVYTGTNHLEGLLSGALTVTNANTSDLRSWNGSGRLELTNGLIWDIPIFGIFSPILDRLQKGLGESRADKGSAAFTITNSIIYSDDLQFSAPAVEMLYRGNVDFSGNVDATVQARLLHALPVVGPLVSTALRPFTWLFEYKVTGTLAQPKSEPRFDFTRFLLDPFQMIRQRKAAESGTSTNSLPPVKSP
jgi:AsmA-like C-terminal region